MQEAGDPDGVKDDAAEEAGVDLPENGGDTQTDTQTDTLPDKPERSEPAGKAEAELFPEFVGQDEPDVDPDDAVAGEESPEGEGDETEGDDPNQSEETETAADAEGEDAEKEQGEATPENEDVVQHLSERTNSNFESVEDVEETIRTLQTQNAAAQEYVGLLEQDPQLAGLIQNYVQSEGDLREAVLGTVDHLESSIPDPAEDPEAYADWKAQQKIQQQQEQQKQEEQRRLEEVQEIVQEQASQAWENYVRNQDMGEQEAQALARDISKVVNGDLENGQIAPAMFKRLHMAARPQEFLNRERERIRKEERNKIMEELEKHGSLEAEDGLPWMSGGGGGSDPGDSQPSTGAQIVGGSPSRGFDHSQI